MIRPVPHLEELLVALSIWRWKESKVRFFFLSFIVFLKFLTPSRFWKLLKISFWLSAESRSRSHRFIVFYPSAALKDQPKSKLRRRLSSCRNCEVRFSLPFFIFLSHFFSLTFTLCLDNYSSVTCAFRSWVSVLFALVDTHEPSMRLLQVKSWQRKGSVLVVQRVACLQGGRLLKVFTFLRWVCGGVRCCIRLLFLLSLCFSNHSCFFFISLFLTVLWVVRCLPCRAKPWGPFDKPWLCERAQPRWSDLPDASLSGWVRRCVQFFFVFFSNKFLMTSSLSL